MTSGWDVVRIAERPRPCLHCAEPTRRISVLAFHGDGESGPFTVERAECEWCAHELEAMGEALAAIPCEFCGEPGDTLGPCCAEQERLRAWLASEPEDRAF